MIAPRTVLQLVVVVALVTTSLGPTALASPVDDPARAANQERPSGTFPTVADAPPGTVFQTHYSFAERRRSVGLVKRGHSRDLLFNPSTDLVRLRAGDGLVSRSGQYYRVTTPQELDGGTGFVGPGATVYNGEDDLRYVGFRSGELVGTGTAEESSLGLDGAVSASQPVGRYRDPSNRSLELVVERPRVTNLQVVSQRGRAVVPNGTVQSTEFVVVTADVNFLDAARARIRLVDAGTGTPVTNGVLTRRNALVRFPLAADLIGRFVPERKAAPEGPDGTRRSLVNPAHGPNTTIFLVQDLRPVVRDGTYEFVVEADTGGRFGRLATAGASQRFRVTLERTALTDEGDVVVEPPEARFPVVTSPAGTYVSGDVVDVRGTAPPGTRAVAVYVRPARGSERWELLTPSFSWVFVGPDGRWAVSSVQLSTESWVLRRPGEYRIGVIPVRGADLDGDSYADGTLRPTRFDRGGGNSRPLTVVARTTPTKTTTERPRVTTITTTTRRERPTTTTTTAPTPPTTTTTRTAVAEDQPILDGPVVIVGVSLAFAVLLLLALARRRR